MFGAKKRRYLNQLGQGADAVTLFQTDPVRFMKSQVIIVGTSQAVNRAKGLYNMTLEAEDVAQCTLLEDGSENYAFTLREALGTEPSFSAFWCPYQQDGRKSVMIDRQADFVFTFTMDGCSLGLGSRTATGARLVTHVNCAWAGDQAKKKGATNAQCRLAQAQAQLGQLQMKHHAPGLRAVIGPAQYMQEGVTLAATTVGIRKTKDNWNFYVQRYIPSSMMEMRRKLLDVVEVYKA